MKQPFTPSINIHRWLIALCIIAGCLPPVPEKEAEKRNWRYLEKPVKNIYIKSLRGLSDQPDRHIEQLALLSLAQEKAARGDVTAQRHLDELYNLDVEKDYERIMNHYKRIFANEEGYFIDRENGFIEMVMENAKHIKHYKGYDPFFNILTDWGRLIARKGPPDAIRNFSDSCIIFEKDDQLFSVVEDRYGMRHLGTVHPPAYYFLSSLPDDNLGGAGSIETIGATEAQRKAQDDFLRYQRYWTIPVDPEKLLAGAIITIDEYLCPNIDTCWQVTPACYTTSQWDGKSFIIDWFNKVENFNREIDSSGQTKVIFDITYAVYAEDGNTCLMSANETYQPTVTNLTEDSYIHVRELLGPYPNHPDWSYKVVAEISHGGRAKKKIAYIDYRKDRLPMMLTTDQPPVKGLPIFDDNTISKGDSVEIICWFDRLAPAPDDNGFSGMAYLMLLPEKAPRGHVTVDDMITDYEIVDSVFSLVSKITTDYDSVMKGFEPYQLAQLPINSEEPRGILVSRIKMPSGGLRAGSYNLAAIFYTRADDGGVKSVGQAQLVVELK